MTTAITKLDEQLGAVAAGWDAIPEDVRAGVAEKLTAAMMLAAEAFNELKPHLEPVQGPILGILSSVVPQVMLSTDRGAAIERLGARIGGHFPTVALLLEHVPLGLPSFSPEPLELEPEESPPAEAPTE